MEMTILCPMNKKVQVVSPLIEKEDFRFLCFGCNQIIDLVKSERYNGHVISDATESFSSSLKLARTAYRCSDDIRKWIWENWKVEVVF